VFLLDTHVWLWSVEGNARRIGPRTRRMLARAEAAGTLRVSPMTLFEVVALHTLGRLRLVTRPDDWIREALESGGVRIAELSPEIAIDAGSIARTALGDPIDRLLVATASRAQATLLTSDARILGYAKASGRLVAHNAST
jgi:PIN domain nuclease of toxin-antitoxin system